MSSYDNWKTTEPDWYQEFPPSENDDAELRYWTEICGRDVMLVKQTCQLIKSALLEQKRRTGHTVPIEPLFDIIDDHTLAIQRHIEGRLQ